MSLYVSDSGARGGTYNENVGIDIDGEIVSSVPGGGDYYDYDLLTRPSVSGSGIIVPPSDDGFPSIDDYIVNPDGSKQLKQFLVKNQSDPVNTMLGGVNNGRMNDINIVKEVSVPEGTDIVIKKDNNDSSIKGLLEQNSVNDIFFSEMNTKVVQDTIRYKVHQNTQQIISEQSTNDLFIIMRSIMLQFANFRTGIDNIVDEIKRLNEMVVKYSVDNVTSNVKQHQGYIADLSKLPTPMDNPVYHNKRNFTYDMSNLL